MESDTPGHDTIPQQIAELRRQVAALESRIARMEQGAGALSSDTETSPSPSGSEKTRLETSLSQLGRVSLEQRIGEYWFGRLGIVILILGMFFLISYAFANFRPFWQIVVGYGITLALFGLSKIRLKRFALFSNLLLAGSLVLLYFVSLRMHFYRELPIIESKFFALALLSAVVCVQLVIAIRRRSQYLAAIPVILGYLTALLSDTHHFALIVIVVTSVVAALLMSIYHWEFLGIGSIILSYGSFLLYLLNDPLLGRGIRIMPEHDWMLFYLVGTLVVFTLVSFRPGVNKYFHTVTRILLTTVNSSGFYLVAFIVTFQFFRPHLSFWNFIFAGILFGIAVAHWTIRQSKYSTSFYASFSFIALTVGILAATSTPDVYLWLVWQSALVIGSAIWFRSGIIVWANMGIYLVVFGVYLITGVQTGLVDFNFVLVALLSERLLEYSRARIARFPRAFQYTYVFTGYVMLISGLTLTLPMPTISVAWLVVSVGYFATGYLFDLPSYRIMGIGSSLLTVGRIFLVDLASLELIYRVLSFIVVGFGLLIVGLLYARIRA